MSACADHADRCDRCPTCESGRCCGEQVVDANLPVQGEWIGEQHAPLGELVADDQGRLVCHVCGLGFDSLQAHVRAHAMTPTEYRAWFGLRVGEVLASERLRAARRRDTFGASRNTTPPSLTPEQLSEVARNREQRLAATRDPEQMAAMARKRGPRSDEERARQRAARRSDDPGHACPECGALVCTWTGRASGYSTQRTLCGQDECLRAARSRAAIVANRKRWAS